MIDSNTFGGIEVDQVFFHAIVGEYLIKVDHDTAYVYDNNIGCVYLKNGDPMACLFASDEPVEVE